MPIIYVKPRDADKREGGRYFLKYRHLPNISSKDSPHEPKARIAAIQRTPDNLANKNGLEMVGHIFEFLAEIKFFDAQDLPEYSQNDPEQLWKADMFIDFHRKIMMGRRAGRDTRREKKERRNIYPARQPGPSQPHARAGIAYTVRGTSSLLFLYIYIYIYIYI